MNTLPLLDDQQMQRFIRDGYITLQTQAPASLNQSLHRQIGTLFAREGNPGNDILPKVPDLYEILETPTVRGALSSLLGPEYIVHPHRHCHLNPGNSAGQNMHQDSYENDQNVRHHRCRWAMGFYYPQDVTQDNGPSSILPATQHYNSEEEALARSELPLVGAAGTFTIVHYDLWHRAMPNRSDDDRFMVKFLFARLREPKGPAWDHANTPWQPATTDGPPADLCRNAWRWFGAQEPMASGDTSTSPAALAHTLSTAGERERLEAAYALTAHGAEGIALLVDALHTEAKAQAQHNLERAHTNPSQLHSALALTSAGPAAMPDMLALLSSDSWPLRAAATTILGDLGLQAIEAVPQLCQCATDDDEWVRRNAVEALGTIAAAEAVPTLCTALADPSDLVRHNAALALAKIGPAAAPAQMPLREALADDNLYVRENARIALAQIKA